MDTRSGLTFTVNGIIADLSREVLRAESGELIVLRPQCFAVLRCLSENVDRLVTKDELMQAVWPATAVTDDSLVQCIHEIRRALNDEGHEVLKTVSKRGYRLVLPVKSGPAAPVSLPPRKKRRLATAAGLLLLFVAGSLAWWLSGAGGRIEIADSGTPAIAVLPFDNLGGDPEQNYFADGMTEDLITDLSKFPGIFVIARNSVWKYRTRPADEQQIARELGVRYLLEGSVRREGDHIRINAHLIDTLARHDLWADRYDGTLSNVFTLQDRVIGHIVTALAVRLTSAERASAEQVETGNPQAYDAVLQGLDLIHRDTEPETLKAIALFEKAVALDPGYGRAYAALAAAHWRISLSYWFTSAGSGWQHAYENLNANLAKAMEHPTPLAFAVQSQVLAQQGRYDEAFAAIERALALAPNDPDNHVDKARILNATGHALEAESEVRIAMRFDPRFAPATLRGLSIALFNQQRYQEAVDTIERILVQDAATTDDYLALVSAFGHLGRTEGLKEAVDKYNALVLPAAYDPMTVQEGYWNWNGELFSYHRPYVDKLVEGLSKAGLPEGAGAELPLDAYKRFIRRAGGEFIVAGATQVDAPMAKALHDRGVPFIDVRAHLDFDNGHIPGARNQSLVVDLSKENLANIAAPGDEVVFYCHGKYCPYSAYAAAKAVAWGYQRVYRFAGGFPEWQDAGYPVETTANK